MFKSKYLKCLVTFVLVTIFVLSSFSVSSYAANSFTYALSDFTVTDGSDVPVIFSRRNHLNKSCTLVFNDVSNDWRITAFQTISSGFKIGTSYTLTFSACKNFSGKFACSLYLTDNIKDINFENALEVAFIDSDDLNSTSFKDYSIQVQYPDKFNGKQVYLLLMYAGNEGQQSLYITDFVFTDNNASDEEKIDGILDWLNRIYYSIVGGKDFSGTTHIGISQSVKNHGTVLTSKLVDCTNDLKSKLDDCTTSLNSTLKIQLNTLWSNLNTLLNKINSNILSFKSSVESSFNNLLTFLDSKFTILFDKLDTLIKGKDISKDDFDTSGKDNIDNINKDIVDTESNLPDFDGSDFDKVINTDILSDLSKGFIAVNSVFSIVVDKLGFTAVIVFFLSFGLAIYIIGRRLG